MLVIFPFTFVTLSWTLPYLYLIDEPVLVTVVVAGCEGVADTDGAGAGGAGGVDAAVPVPVPLPAVDPVPLELPDVPPVGFLVAPGVALVPVEPALGLEFALWLAPSLGVLEALLPSDGRGLVALALGVPAAPSMAIGASTLKD